ncbi:YoaK family protein [Citrobacter portucalensis]|uniref:DUF1275 family protein n=1 Tax=Citrobacter portucalensis TaxID=1639133 RepID=UPI003AAE1CAE
MKKSSLVYVLCFVGGCMDCISFLLLFHTLLGLMTFNTMYGLIGFFNPEPGIKIGLHLYLVAFFIVSVFLLKLLHEKASVRKAIANETYIRIQVGLIIIYAIAGSYTLRHGLLTPDGWQSFLIVSLGMLPVYLQNYVINHNHKSQTGTVLMTGNYVSMISSFVNWLTQKNSASEHKGTVTHYLKVHGSFCCGVVLMAILSRWVDFLGLLIPAALLMFHSMMFNNKIVVGDNLK